MNNFFVDYFCGMFEGRKQNSKNYKIAFSGATYFPIICIIACFMVLLSGCTPREFCQLPEEMDFEEIAPISGSLDADIYIDASLSMEGFVNPANSYYVRCLQLVERAFISAWPGCKKDFYKFGTNADDTNIEIVPREKLKDAEFPSFYLYTKTHIEKVIDKLDKKKENFSIIITDLFQNQSDVNLLIEKLNKRLLSKEMAVGILGIKSQFDGKVGDVGLIELDGELKELVFEYSAIGKKTVNYRPFYLLMLGKYNDIAHYYKMMRVNGLDSFPEKNFLILCSQVVERLASFENSEIQRSKIKEVQKILRSSGANKHVKQFTVNDNSSKPYFDTTINLSFLNYILDFNSQKLAMEITAWQWQDITDITQEAPKKGKGISKKELVASEEASRALTIKNIEPSDSQLTFRAEVNPKNFPSDGTYCFRIVFHSLSESYSLPRWVSDWDMDENLIYHWQQNPGQFQGNTTLNLKIFLNNIWQIIYQKHKPKVARLYCYISRE